MRTAHEESTFFVILVIVTISNQKPSKIKEDVPGLQPAKPISMANKLVHKLQRPNL